MEGTKREVTEVDKTVQFAQNVKGQENVFLKPDFDSAVTVAENFLDLSFRASLVLASGSFVVTCSCASSSVIHTLVTRD